ncbi:hypothetical protein GALMADRAFT_214558 [Galerina marginata CBS 339.88]|uniref:Uncharacterized protein n=1 Tax=Galerina marginata (strain CBS 339.88) TaxID=685588 RepID=A0A067SUS1_GALM3|nr:hypothetical protein GALMADRAFT_214558 [Galerina marginata CBS 339.88]
MLEADKALSFWPFCVTIASSMAYIVVITLYQSCFRGLTSESSTFPPLIIFTVWGVDSFMVIVSAFCSRLMVLFYPKDLALFCAIPKHLDRLPKYGCQPALPNFFGVICILRMARWLGRWIALLLLPHICVISALMLVRRVVKGIESTTTIPQLSGVVYRPGLAGVEGNIQFINPITTVDMQEGV